MKEETGEAARLEALARLAVLDTPAEQSFDELVGVAAAVCQMPAAVLGLVDDRREWFKASLGTTVTEVPRAVSFAARVVEQAAPFATADVAAFAANPLVAGESGARFYAGAPLRTSDGQVIGALGVLDVRPRELDAKQTETLATLARLAAGQLELRRASLAGADDTTAPAGAHELFCVAGFDGFFKRLSPAFEEVLGFRRAEILARPFVDFVHPDDRAATATELARLSAGAPTVSFVNRYVVADGSCRWLEWHAMPLPSEGVVYAVARDVTAAHRTET